MSFVLVQVIKDTFYGLACLTYRPEFVDWWMTLWSFSLFFEMFDLWCDWSTYYIFLSIFSQTEANPTGFPQKRSSDINLLIDKCQGNIFIILILFIFDQNLSYPIYGV